MYWVYQTIERPKKKLTKAGRKYHKPFSNHQANDGINRTTLCAVVYRVLLQIFYGFFHQFFYPFFLKFFTRLWNGPVISVLET